MKMITRDPGMWVFGFLYKLKSSLLYIDTLISYLYKLINFATCIEQNHRIISYTEQKHNFTEGVENNEHFSSVHVPSTLNLFYPPLLDYQSYCLR